MTQPNLLHVARAAIGLILCASGVVALQDDASFPAVDLPPRYPGFQPVPLVVGTEPSDGVLELDATQFTATPDVSVRDVDGDGILDVTSLARVDTVWRGLGDGRFAPPAFVETTIPVTSPIVGRWGDMNGDGRLDAVFLDFQYVEVITDQGDGTFASPGAHHFGMFIEYAYRSWALGYVDGDAIPDIVARFGYSTPGARVEVLYGLGGDQFSNPEVVAVTAGMAEKVALGDLNGDGLTDIALDHLHSPNKLRTYLQQPGGGWAFAGSITLTAYAAQRIELRDMTADGLLDAIVHEIPSIFGKAPAVSVYVGQGDGSFSSTPHLVPGAGGNALFADMDGDGLVDVVSTGPGTPPGVTTVLTRPDGSMAPPVRTRHRADPQGTADLDGDGVLDLFSERVVLFGRGDGGFVAPRGFDLGTTPSAQRHVALADFDEDGTPDVAALDGNANGLAVSVSGVAASWDLLELTPTKRGHVIATGDLDLDGHDDLVIQQVTDSGQEFWLGRGDGSFTASSTFGQSFLGSLVNSGLGIGQFNGTAWPDLVATGNGMLRRKLGQGPLAFGPLKESPLPPAGISPWLVVRDLDQDGLDDVLVVQPEVYVYRCVGHGDFAPPVLVDGGATHLRLVDVNGDGALDLVVSDGTEVRVRAGDGAGGFAATPTAVLACDRDVFGTDVADVNGDGLPDLALGHGEAWSLHLALAGGGFAAEPVDRFDLSGEAHVLRFIDADHDERPDLLAVSDDSDGFGLSLSAHRDGPWTDHGFALAGADGTPFLWPTGPLLAGSSLGLELRDAAPGVASHLVIGLAGGGVPFKGGVLVPDPLLIVSGIGIGAAGTSVLESPWPPGTPPGTELWLQSWIEDATGPAGVTASNGISGLVP